MKTIIESGLICTLLGFIVGGIIFIGLLPEMLSGTGKINWGLHPIVEHLLYWGILTVICFPTGCFAGILIYLHEM